MVTQMERLEEAVRGLQAQQQDLLERVGHNHAELLDVIHANQQRNLEVMEVLRDAEPAMRRLLWEVRERPSYEAAFTEPEPLVTVAIPTYTNLRLLLERALPSVFAQTYERLEIVVVGDAASPVVEEAIQRVRDSRIRYTNLPYRGPYPEDRRLRWMVAGGPPVNEAVRIANGRWIAFMDDDDASTPDRIELLLKAARDRRLEFCYGRVRQHQPDGSEQIMCEFPPHGPGTVGKSAALLHADLRFFTGELSDSLFENVGDWARINRMMRVGVRIGMIPDVVLEYYPNRLWSEGADW
jgi:glycosyltransferase involved in cell wall biosynthesis